MTRHPQKAAPLARTFLLAAMLLAGGNGQVAFAQSSAPESYEERVIVRIDFDAPESVDLERVRGIIETKPGDIYRSERIRQDVIALSASGRFTNVRVSAQLVDENVTVVFHIQPYGRIREIRFEGHLALPEKELRDMLRTGVGDPADPYRLKLDLQELRGRYDTTGYVFATVEQKTEIDETGGDVVIVYRIDAGRLIRIESVQFEGNTAIPDKRLRKSMVSVEGANPFTFKRGRFDPFLIHADLEFICGLFQDKGYLDATAGYELMLDDSKERGYLIVRVREGPQYRVRRLVVRGAHLFRAGEIVAAMKLQAGVPFSPSQLDTDLDAIKALYGRHGYIMAKATGERLLTEDAPEVTVRITVEEGLPYTVRNVLVRGNERTDDHVIRRELSIIPGERASTDALAESKRRLINTRLFQPLKPTPDREPVRIRYVDTGPGEADAIVEVDEGALGRISFGASWSSDYGGMANLDLSLENADIGDFPRDWRHLRRGAFVGGGQKLALSLSPGTYYNNYRLSWLNPSVWDSPYHVGTDLYLQDYHWANYFELSRAGVLLRGGRRFFKDLRVSLQPHYERLSISDIDTGAPPDAAAVRGDYDRHALSMSAVYDKRDNVLFSTTGYRLAGDVEMIGSGLGGDINVVKESIEAQKFWTLHEHPGWGRHVLQVGARFGIMQDTRGGDVPIFERNFIGGLGSMRGFEVRGAGPVDPGTGRHIGGKYLGLASVEYSAPIVRDYVRGIVFVDGGALENRFAEIDARSVRASVGTGIRLRIPVLGAGEVPLVFNLATPVRKLNTDDKEVFSFSMGTGFAF